MAYEIRWSPDARRDYFAILDYLNARWTEKEAIHFIDRTEQILQLISDNPFLFVSSAKKPEIHRCVIVSQVSLFYKVKNNQVELLRFWDNRMDPEKLNY
jgi:plasmid stabilization system protein ParE